MCAGQGVEFQRRSLLAWFEKDHLVTPELLIGLTGLLLTSSTELMESYENPEFFLDADAKTKQVAGIHRGAI